MFIRIIIFFYYYTNINTDLTTKFATFPNLKVRRKQRVISTEKLDGSNESLDSNSIIKAKSPEFIINSSLPSQLIDLTDIKVIYLILLLLIIELKSKFM